MNQKPKVLVLKADGTNCDEELYFAFKIAGGAPKIIHINEIKVDGNVLDKIFYASKSRRSPHLQNPLSGKASNHQTTFARWKKGYGNFLWRKRKKKFS